MVEIRMGTKIMEECKERLNKETKPNHKKMRNQIRIHTIKLQ
jgi:hypothetical protein